MLLARINEGDVEATEELLPLVYEHLRAMAGACFRGQRASHTLQPTALVHEAYLKLIRSQNDWKSRAHFYAVASIAMRQVLSNYARSKKQAMRDGTPLDVTLDAFPGQSGPPNLDFVALDLALTKLAELDARHARIVELRFFTGLQNEEIAHVLGTSISTVEREWRKVRAWLNRELAGSEGGA